MTVLERVPGQSPLLPGAVRYGDLVVTSGMVAPSALAGDPSPGPDFSPGLDFRDEADEALATLLAALARFGVGPDRIIRVEAFLADAADVPVWNDAFRAIWPEPGPARTTLVSQFAAPGIRIEVQAIAAA